MSPGGARAQPGGISSKGGRVGNVTAGSSCLDNEPQPAHRKRGLASCTHLR